MTVHFHSMNLLHFPQQGINGGDLPTFVEQLSNATLQNDVLVVSSQATVTSIVTILDNIATASSTIKVDQEVMEVWCFEM